MTTPRSIWNGSVTFGSVVVPVKLFTATEDRTLRFREVRESDGSPIEHKRVGAETGEEIAFKEIEKAYDTGDGQIVLTKEEIAASEGPNPKVVAIEHFVRAEQIDPAYYDKPYYVGARPGGEHAYRVLLAALEQSGRVGIGRFMMRSKEQLVAVRPLGGALGLQTMRFADELVPKKDLELPSLSKKPSEAEAKMAGQLIEMLHGDWDAQAHEDTYRDAVRAMIESKLEGAKLPAAGPRKPASDDLMAALEASLAETGKSKAAPAKSKSTDGENTTTTKKTTTRSSTAKKTSATAAKPKRSPTAGKGKPAVTPKKKAS